MKINPGESMAVSFKSLGEGSTKLFSTAPSDSRSEQL